MIIYELKRIKRISFLELYLFTFKSTLIHDQFLQLIKSNQTY